MSSSSAATSGAAAYDFRDPLASFQAVALQAALSAIKSAYGQDVDSKLIKFTTPPDRNLGDLCFPCFTLGSAVGVSNPSEIARKLEAALQGPNFECKATGAYVNFKISAGYLAQVVTDILSGQFLSQLPRDKPKTMIEYSQPNSHKAFHVGHMRNVAIGDALVRIYEHVGHPVIAANYFGDEGAHVAKCLWLLQLFMKQKGVSDPKLLNTLVPKGKARGEWLGQFYSAAVDNLDLSSLTNFPHPGVFAAKVLSIGPHPNASAPANWHLVRVSLGGEPIQVVCGGMGYQVGDLVAYVPVGQKWNGKEVAAKEMLGIPSHGIILAKAELGEEDPAPAAAAAAPAADAESTDGEAKHADTKPAKGGKKDKKNKQPAGEETESASATAAPEAGSKKAKTDKGAKKKGKGGGGDDADDTQQKKIKVINAADNVPVGVELAEFYRITAEMKRQQAEREEKEARETGKPKKDPPPVVLPEVPQGVRLADAVKQRDTQVRQTLQAMEGGDKAVCALWDETKEWSIKEFKQIYAWLGARFDHDFFESEVGEEGKHMTDKYLKKGVLITSNGAVGCDLSEEKLGFCMLLKSDGTGLYATKDIALALRKFDQFKIEKSLYVVDAAQKLHFQQVFKTLEKMGYDQAKHCVHLPYGQVVRKEGKMSSRKGNVYFFSLLKEELDKAIHTNFMEAYIGQWTPEQIADAVHRISVSSIRYGMLNHDLAKDVVFEVDHFLSTKGHTGPYMMYGYARINSIFDKIKPAAGVPVDLTVLKHPLELTIMIQLAKFWPALLAVKDKHNLQGWCEYLFTLAQAFSAFYENLKVRDSPDAEKNARLALIRAVSMTLKTGMELLGIQLLDKM